MCDIKYISLPYLDTSQFVNLFNPEPCQHCTNEFDRAFLSCTFVLTCHFLTRNVLLTLNIFSTDEYNKCENVIILLKC